MRKQCIRIPRVSKFVSATNRQKRLLLHLPVGLVTALACWKLPVVGIALLVAFIYYETNEDRHIKDQAWIDVAGFIWGLAIAAIAIIIYQYAGGI